MSIILDALKKLEQKRQQDAVPNLSTVHTPNLHKPKKRPFWPILLIIALVLNGIILTAWLRPWSSEVDTSAQTAPANYQDYAEAEKEGSAPDLARADITDAEPAKTPDAEDSELKGEPESKPDTIDLPPILEPEIKPAAAMAEKTVPETLETESEKPSTEEQLASLDLNPSIEELEKLKETVRQEQEHTASNTIPADEPSSDSYEDNPEREILDLSELPGEIRKEIPDISIFGHIYSSRSSSRLANINGSLVHEGDKVKGKLKVIEITVTGVIFDYDGLQFKVRAF